MIINIFKIKIFHLIIILIISIPFGYYIYQKNVGKISYVAYIKPSKLITEDYCVNFVEIPNIILLDSNDLRLASKKINQAYIDRDPVFKGGVVMGYNKDKKAYQINYGAKKEDVNLIMESILSAIADLSSLERESFTSSYEDVKLHCYGKIFPLYKFKESDNTNYDYVINDSYSSTHIYIGAFSPAFILYLVYIFFCFFKVNKSSLIRKDNKNY